MAGGQKIPSPKERLAVSSSGGSSSSQSRNSRSEASAPASPSAASGRTRGSPRGGYDGSADPAPSNAAAGSTTPRSAPATPRSASATPATTSATPATSQQLLFEPKNFDLGMAGWATARGQEISSTLPPRPGPSKLGDPQKIGLNTFHVDKFPTIPVYQWDVVIGSGTEKRGVIYKVWNSKAVQSQVGPYTIFDGNKLAWSGKTIDRELRITVDLDAEQGRQPRPGGADVHRIVIRQTLRLAFQTLLAYLQGKASFDNSCLATVNFADHLLRYTPSQKYTAIKRAFFQRGEQRFSLGGGVEAFKGCYQSLRLVHPGRMSVNVDVSNGTFWTAQPFHKAAVHVCNARSESDLVVILSKGENGRAGKELKKMRRLHVVAQHRGKQTVDEYVVDGFIYQSAKTYKFKAVNPQGNEVQITIYDYFASKHGIRLSYPDLPLVRMTRRNVVMPMEVLRIKENQRYVYKMDERQTANMIKFAVTAPKERWAAIQHGLKMLSWEQDPILAKYGLKVNPNKVVVDARLLVAPTVKFGTGDAKPLTSGRWDLKGKKFLKPNLAPLKAWGVCVVPGRRGGKPDKTVIQNFVNKFIQAYISHGGKVERKDPWLSLAIGEDAANWVKEVWNGAGQQSQFRPQILVFILPDKDSITYGRIKRYCECRYGVVSQCVQYAHALKAQPQYLSNVCMKFNAKLGGTTCRAVGRTSAGPHGIFNKSTMIIGADVSHSAPGVMAPSMAAMTVSMDDLGARYATLCQSNGFRVEMINTDILTNDLRPFFDHWIKEVGGGKVPQTVIYLRDGVSEGQYQHVLLQEVADMKALMKAIDPACSTKWVVIVGGKRHHVRFFPAGKADTNGNALPGTLVETGVTNPFENDFYLQSHAAIKGTARPVHYHVLKNEAGLSNDWIQTMLYEHAYQYARASTPVSIHPAIYYAHLASNRAVPHDPMWAGSSDKGVLDPDKPGLGYPNGVPQYVPQPGAGAGAGAQNASTATPATFQKLFIMPNLDKINTAMWYI